MIPGLFDLLGGRVARAGRQAGFIMRFLMRRGGAARLPDAAEIGPRLLAGLRRDFPLSRDEAAWETLRRARALMNPLLRRGGVALKPVVMDLPGALAFPLPGDFVIVSPEWVARVSSSFKETVFHLATMRALSLLGEPLQRCTLLVGQGVPPAAEVLRLLSPPPRNADMVFQADAFAMDLCLAAGFGPDAALDAIARLGRVGRPVTPALRAERLRKLLPGG